MAVSSPSGDVDAAEKCFSVCCALLPPQCEVERPPCSSPDHAPDLVARLEPFDTTLVVWPDAKFTGTVLVGDERFDVDGVPGSFYHYWGRRLPDRWVWLSATQFDGRADRRVEGVFGVSTRLFGRAPMPLPVSILWTTDQDRCEELVHGVNAIMRVHPLAGAVTVDARGVVGARHRLVATWADVAPNDLGGVIINDIPTYRMDHMPYGGVKDSGQGREGVRYAMEDMTEIRLMVLAPPG